MSISSHAVVLCSGKGSRFGDTKPKQFVMLNGYPIIFYILNTLLNCNFKINIYLVILEEYKQIVNNILDTYIPKDSQQKIHLVIGDQTRQRSIQKAQQYINSKNANTRDHVFVLDGVRPLVSSELLEEMNRLNDIHPVIGTYTDCVSTILEKEQDQMKSSLVRSKLAESHTPQIFRFDIFDKMYQHIDDYSLEHETECLNIASKFADTQAYLYKTSLDQVMKITYKFDINIAEQFLKTKYKRVILITGGSKGIGRQLAMKLSNLGFKVIICSRNREELSKVADDLEVDYYTCDISNRKMVNEMFEYISKKYNTLDILINNAAISHKIENIEEIDYNTLDSVIDINLKGSFYCSQEALKIMKVQGKGSIITIGSSGINGGRSGQSAYLCSKNALKTLTECIALEGKSHNIFSYFVVPRRTNTDMRSKMYPLEDKTLLLDINELVNNITFIISENIPNLSGSSFWIK